MIFELLYFLLVKLLTYYVRLLQDLEESFKDVENTKIVVNGKKSTSSNKRTAEDLFGDIGDIDFNDDFGMIESFCID